MNYEKGCITKNCNVTVAFSPEELDALDRYLRPLCGKKAPFIRLAVLDRIGFDKPGFEEAGNGGKAERQGGEE